MDMSIVSGAMCAPQSQRLTSCTVEFGSLASMQYTKAYGVTVCLPSETLKSRANAFPQVREGQQYISSKLPTYWDTHVNHDGL
jgi:hypothetical protein